MGKNINMYLWSRVKIGFSGKEFQKAHINRPDSFKITEKATENKSEARETAVVHRCQICGMKNKFRICNWCMEKIHQNTN